MPGDDPRDFATPRVAAGVLLVNSAGEVLIVKPTYKDGWDIPGGYVNIGESPRAAAIREAREEIGIELNHLRFAGVDWAPADHEGDKLLFLFTSDGDTPEVEKLTLAPDEIADAQYVPQAILTERLPDRLVRRVLRTVGSDVPTYLEHGDDPTT